MMEQARLGTGASLKTTSAETWLTKTTCSAADLLQFVVTRQGMAFLGYILSSFQDNSFAQYKAPSNRFGPARTYRRQLGESFGWCAKELPLAHLASGISGFGGHQAESQGRPPERWDTPGLGSP